jgi:hypothetical protein
VLLGVGFSRIFGMVPGVRRMAPRSVSMMGRLFVLAAIVMFGRFVVMTGCVGMMFRGFSMVFRRLLRHGFSLSDSMILRHNVTSVAALLQRHSVKLLSARWFHNLPARLGADGLSGARNDSDEC